MKKCIINMFSGCFMVFFACGLSACAESVNKGSILPKLRARQIHPVRDIEIFSHIRNSSSFDYRQGKDWTMPLQNFDTEEEAVSLARNFISEHFGPLMVELQVRNIECIASGENKASRSNQTKYSISFDCYYKGYLLPAYFALVCIHGKQVFSANINLPEIEVIEGTERPIITMDEARRRMATYLYEKKAMQHTLPEPVVLELTYYDFIEDTQPHLVNGRWEVILRPQWRVKSTEFFIEAISGKVWHDD